MLVNMGNTVCVLHIVSKRVIANEPVCEVGGESLYTRLTHILGNEPCKQSRINRITSHLHHVNEPVVNDTRTATSYIVLRMHSTQ